MPGTNTVYWFKAAQRHKTVRKLPWQSQKAAQQLSTQRHIKGGYTWRALAASPAVQAHPFLFDEVPSQRDARRIIWDDCNNMQQIQRIVGLTRVEQKNSNEEQLSSNQITSNFKTQLHQLDQAQHLNMCRHMPPHSMFQATTPLYPCMPRLGLPDDWSRVPGDNRQTATRWQGLDLRPAWCSGSQSDNWQLPWCSLASTSHAAS